MNLKICGGLIQVLIIEDDPCTQKLIQFVLSKIKIESATVENITQAWTYLENNRPRLIITDFNLPDGNGINFTKRLHRMYPSLPIFGCSTEWQSEWGFLKAGASRFFRKPIQFDQFSSEIKEWIEKSN